MEKAVLKVEGMTCSSCAQGISRQLQKKGLLEVLVSFDSGEVEFSPVGEDQLQTAINEINNLGYKVVTEEAGKKTKSINDYISRLEFRFALCLAFTLPLAAPMFFHGLEFLHRPVVQFFLCLPVLMIGMMVFGRSAWGAVRSRHSNMDVLISIGSLSAFVYSCAGWALYAGTADVLDYLFFETTAVIITLLLLGNLIERRSLKKTQEALTYLSRIQPSLALLILDALTPHEHTKEVEAGNLKVNDLIQVNTGDQVPADGQVYEGHATVDESMMTGESLPVEKAENDTVMSGTIVLSGNIKVIVKQAGHETVLSRMIETVRKSALRKPEIQRFGDRVSAWFVPVVIGVSLLTFLLNWMYFNVDTSASVLRAIAVLVISCPCAMGLATPTAVSVGIGRAAKSGILIKGGDTLERLSQVDYMVFDKTGTLTEGKMKLLEIQYHADEHLVNYLLGTLEQYSGHPFAVCLTATFRNAPSESVRFSKVEEIPGEGILASDIDGNEYRVGSRRFTGSDGDDTHQVFLTRNGMLMAAASFEDPIRQEARRLTVYLKQNGITPVLLSGDRELVCRKVAGEIGIEEIYSECLPDKKVEIITKLQQKGRVAMAGDGINDAAALSVSSVGIALGGGMQVTKQTAEIVLIGRQELTALMNAHLISKATLKTIRQNLTWALLYNVVAIPMAAMGMLSPGLSSLSMAFSDVVVVGNSLRLRYFALSE